MANYNLTVTTNANEEKGLDFILARVNAARAAETPPKAAWNKTQLLEWGANGLVQDWRSQYKGDFRQRVGTALDTTATNAQVTQVAGILGVSE